MSARRMLIDAGNSSLKWAVVEGGHWRGQGRFDYADWSALQAEMTSGSRCFIASVAQPAQAHRLAELLAAAGMIPVWLKAGPDFAGLKNTYQNPRQLGVDRWMGLIAARERSREAVLVVSAGTAMTVDALSADGRFLGGVIVPGAMLMRQSLLKGTAQVAETAGKWEAFPRNTADAVQSGVVAALCGAIQLQFARLSEAVGAAPTCLLTGGDAGMLLPHLNVPVVHAPALILEGIDRVAREGASE
jgi:type III pantothenate kinase